MDGQPIDYAGLEALGIRFTPGALNASKLNQLALYCTEQHDTVGAGWASDICCSNWNRDCPFKPEAAPRVARYAFPVGPVVAPVVPSPPRPVAFREMSPEVHAARIRASIAALGITMADASRVIGVAGDYVGQVLRKLRPLHRLEELDAVLDAMRAGKR